MFGRQEEILVVLKELLCMVNDANVCWDHIRLGGIPTVFYLDAPAYGYKHLYRVPWALCSHAYIITRDFGEHIVKQKYHMPFDIAINFWSPFGQFICEPMICFQRDDASDNVHALCQWALAPIREMITHRRCMLIMRVFCFSYRWPSAVVLGFALWALVTYLAHVKGMVKYVSQKLKEYKPLLD